MACNASANGIEMSINLSVIGGFVARKMQPQEHSHYDNYDRADD
jgi:hypothetical protein